ncbi:MAG: hypothetical protein JNN15_03945 [Blastocatellia bacterium]|nr:hypothetical protein [Blastocatellia bacterium]
MIKNCLYCAGTGFFQESDRSRIDTIIKQTRVICCPSCGIQNRIYDAVLNEDPSEQALVLCYTCRLPLFSKGVGFQLKRAKKL